MRILRLCICLLTVSLLTLPVRAQDSAPKKESGTLQESAPGSKGEKADTDAVPEKVVPEKEAIQQLMGDYRIVSGENSGEEILPERLTDVTVRFTEKTITTYDGEKNQRFSAVYRLDTQQRPWRIKMTSSPRPSNAAAGNGAASPAPSSDGLIELAERRVKVIYALPGGTAPKAFQTGERQQMFVLERLPDPTEIANEAKGKEQAKE